MAERIVSPGVFTKEIDQSFIAGGVALMGASVIGTTLRGPALIPTKITSYSEFENKFGGFTNDSYVPYVVKNYLQNGNVITVTRLLYEAGYKLTNGAIAILQKSSSGQTGLNNSASYVSHILHPVEAVPTEGTGNVFENTVATSSTTGNGLTLKVSGSFTNPSNTAIGFTGTFLSSDFISASLNPNDNNYINTVFSTSPKSIDYPVYVQFENKDLHATYSVTTRITSSAIPFTYAVESAFKSAETPFITSQKVGSITTDLFKFHTLSHGNALNFAYKIGISNIRLGIEKPGAGPNYGSFDVQIYRINTSNIPQAPLYNDTSTDPIETYTNCNLDPTSTDYIARKIGDKSQSVSSAGDVITSGDFPNISSHIRVEVTANVKNKLISKTLVPFGFRSMKSPIPIIISGSMSASLYPVQYATTQLISTMYNANNFFGFDFTTPNNINYLCPFITTGANTGSNSDFYLGNMSQDAAAGYPVGAIYSASIQNALTASDAFFIANIDPNTRKFMVAFQGGFDGAKPNLPKYSGANIAAENVFGFNCENSTATGTLSYKKALSLLSNADYYDMNMILTPGILNSIHPAVTNAARTLAVERQDTFYVMDAAPIGTSISAVINNLTTMDNNYTATYWPWLKTLNPETNMGVWVPPGVLLPGILAFNDANAAPWYAPAGLNRGGVSSASETYINLSQTQRDSLYEARINPIANFKTNGGICVWGQKTLQSKASALDRINVRRLLIAVKKFIASSTRYLVFEQNSLQTRSKFLNIVNPYMEQVKANQGLYAFRVIMDSSNNTPDIIDQNILYGQIFLQPTRTAEFIVLDFNIQATGASFPAGV